MAYKNISIRKAIHAIADGEYVLPSIQREFIWTEEQIVTLFDSLMQGYPISTFLFWQIKAKDTNKFKFYSFLKDYHERDARHNMEASLSGNKDIVAILDGQQRLTSLYLGLQGSYSSKLSYHRRSNDRAYPKKHLYLNLLKKLKDTELEYDFRFLTEDEALQCDTSTWWYKVGAIMGFDDVAIALESITYRLDKFSDNTEEKLDTEAKKHARITFHKLYDIICREDTLNFFLEEGDKLDKVLQIFIRINQGGTKLSYSDLLLSIATAQWKELDARKEIHGFVDRINDIGKGFSFNKDFALKSCLVLADIKDVKFKVDNFSLENMEIIESEWTEISNAIELAVKLSAHFGFDGKTLTATSALIPIAYFLKKNGKTDSILHSIEEEGNRSAIKKWLIRALLKRAFGGQPDNLYPIYRKIIIENGDTFPLQTIIANFSGRNRDLDFHEDDVDVLLDVEYGSVYTFMLLSLFCPINHGYEFHQDHIHPKKYFTTTSLRKLGIEDPEVQKEYLTRVNKLANLQLLQETPNMEKAAMFLPEWLGKHYKDPHDMNRYKDLHFFPAEQSLDFCNFIHFYDARKERIRSRLIDLLGVKRTPIAGAVPLK